MLEQQCEQQCMRMHPRAAPIVLSVSMSALALKVHGILDCLALLQGLLLRQPLLHCYAAGLRLALGLIAAADALSWCTKNT